MIELRISAPLATKEAAVTLLLELGVEASITLTSNVTRSAQGDLCVEEGLHLLLPNCEKEDFVRRVWPAMKGAWNLRCGWMDASSRGFRGCTENFCQESVCPARRHHAAALN